MPSPTNGDVQRGGTHADRVAHIAALKAQVQVGNHGVVVPPAVIDPKKPIPYTAAKGF